jgi:hypothetical protein
VWQSVELEVGRDSKLEVGRDSKFQTNLLLVSVTWYFRV